MFGCSIRTLFLFFKFSFLSNSLFFGLIQLPIEVLVRRQIERLLDPSLQCIRHVHEELIKVKQAITCLVVLLFYDFTSLLSLHTLPERAKRKGKKKQTNHRYPHIKLWTSFFLFHQTYTHTLLI